MAKQRLGNRLQVVVSDDELALIAEAANKSDESVSSVGRMLILEGLRSLAAGKPVSSNR